MVTSNKEVLVPDIGGATDGQVIEVAVKPGDSIKAEQTLITLESDKATMEIPAPCAGVIQELKVKVGDKVSEGSFILTLASDETKVTKQEATNATIPPKKAEESASGSNQPSKIVEIKIPDIGTDSAVTVIDMAIKRGTKITQDATLITLESDKATMEVPAPFSGGITDVKIKVGDKVKQGDVIALAQVIAAENKNQSVKAEQPVAALKQAESSGRETAEKANASAMQTVMHNAEIHAGPAVRRLANQLGVDLSKVAGSGRKGRVVEEDVHQFVKKVLQGGGSSNGLAISSAPIIDFSKFGTTQTQLLSRIKKITGINMHRNWVTVPHVTQFDEADITEMEAFRQANKAEAEKAGAKLTPLVFIMKAVVAALKAYPQFNASLDSMGENLILKKYFHLGVAVDTLSGLVVPVIRDVDQKSLIQLSLELAAISKKAREGKLLPTEMQGGCFTISSLGGIGGTAFTPIVNCPEVAILGVSKSEIKPKYINNEFKPRLMLPLSLSYDHRVIDGADGARFVVHLVSNLTDLRKLLL